MRKRYTAERSFDIAFLGFFLFINIFYLLTQFCVEPKKGGFFYEARDIEIINNLGQDVDLLFYSKDEKVEHYSLRWPVNQKFLDYSNSINVGENNEVAIPLNRGQLITQVFQDYNYIGSIINDTDYFGGKIEISQSNLKNIPKIKRVSHGSKLALVFYSLIFALYFFYFRKFSGMKRIILLIFIPVILIDIFHLLNLIWFLLMY